MDSYRSENPEWEVILDLDELAKQEEEKLGVAWSPMFDARRSSMHDFLVSWRC